jgi:hypothetical protein
MAVNEAVIRAILRFYNYNADEHFNNVEVPEGIKKKQNKRQTDKRNKRFKSDRDANDDAEDVSPSVNKIKVKTKTIFDKQGGKKKAPEPLIGDIDSGEDDIENYFDQEEADEDDVKDYSDPEELDTEDVSPSVNKIKDQRSNNKFYEQGGKKKAHEPLIGDDMEIFSDEEEAKKDDMEDCSDLDLDMEPFSNEEEAKEDDMEDFSDLDLSFENEVSKKVSSSTKIPPTKYERYLAGEDFGWTAGDTNPSAMPSSRPNSHSSSSSPRSSTKVFTKHLAPAKKKSRLQRDGTDESNITEGKRKRKQSPIDWDYEYSQ